MSNLTEAVTNQADNVAAPCQAVRWLIHAKTQDLGDFSVRRLLPHARQRMVGPWLFFDHLGPVDFPPGQGIDVRPHPHIHLATVTYLFAGEILHRDSLGNVIPIQPGAINLMVAGQGIVHSERTAPALRAAGHRLHALQLWLALPTEQEDIAPAFYHFAAESIPTTTVQAVPIRVMMGTAYGIRSPVPTFSPTLYLEAQLAPGQCLTLPDTVSERAVYVASGALMAQGTMLPMHSLTIFNPQPGLTVCATEPTQLALIGGEPVGERFIWWNFVSSRRERIEQAKAEWQAGHFAPVPGEVEFIPLPAS